MKLNTVLRYVGIVLLINALFLFISSIISVLQGDEAFGPLIYSSLVAALFGIFPLLFVPPAKYISNIEGLIIVVSSWLLSCLVGTLPYILWGGEFTFTNAWFESVSGYTTTGSSILTDIEVLPSGLLFWRAATHWLGGMGIIIFVLSVLPSMGIASMILCRLEMSPLAHENFKYNAKMTLRILLSVYVGLTFLETVSLLICGMNLLDAVIHSFATIATGGFSSKNASIGYYNKIGIEVVIMIFMILAGIHFGLLFSAFIQKSKKLFKSEIVRYYFIALIFGIVLGALDLYGKQDLGWMDALRISAFQIISIGTSTGFATADTSVWPPVGQILLIFFALQCACAGSTSGGIKVDRIVLFAKAVYKQLKLLQHPRAIITLKMNGRSIDDEFLAMGILYLSVYLFIILLASILLIALGVDTLSAFSGTVATTGNVGPGLGTVGSVSNYSQIPALGKWILTATMLLGRLEVYGLILFFLPTLWKDMM